MDNGSGKCIAEWEEKDGEWKIKKDNINFTPTPAPAGGSNTNGQAPATAPSASAQLLVDLAKASSRMKVNDSPADKAFMDLFVESKQSRATLPTADAPHYEIEKDTMDGFQDAEKKKQEEVPPRYHRVHAGVRTAQSSAVLPQSRVPCVTAVAP